MTEIKNVSVKKAANVYFDGKVTSRSLTLEDGSVQSLGIMLPGEYEFGTDAKEIMEILSGELEVLLPGEDEWRSIKGGESFEVPGSSKFQLKIHSVTDYCCSYIV
ncbi:pyrimidine/purine nucleoside phosphorylase [Sessilibacter corallicola]|uniref:Pyrimidine/purine nucleoside phosphorylase n=1 Tax=Sessilibacter corallicola TaxID=2904075 RepID=A0ABQ0A9D8_9GAMM